MSKPRELYMKAINGKVTFYDEKPNGNCITWVEKSVANKLADVLEEIWNWEQNHKDCRLFQLCDQALKEYRGKDD